LKHSRAISMTDLYTSTTKEVARYVATALKNSNDFKSAIENLKIPVMVLPNYLPANSTAAQKSSWGKKLKSARKLMQT